MVDPASQLIAGLLGDALLVAFERRKSPPYEPLRAAWNWLKDVADAPPGLELTSPDGATYTGLVFVERSRATLMVAARHAPRPEHARYADGRTITSHQMGLAHEEPWWE